MTFSYRVRTDRRGRFFTKRGDKHLTLIPQQRGKDGGAVKPVDGVLMFSPKKRWGRDSFDEPASMEEVDDTQSPSFITVFDHTTKTSVDDTSATYELRR